MHPKCVLVFSCLSILTISCKKTDNLSTAIKPISATVSNSATGLGLKFGAIVNKSDPNPDGTTGYPDQSHTFLKLAPGTAANYLANTLNVAWARLGINQDDWTGASGSTFKTSLVNAYDAYRTAGLKVALNVNYINYSATPVGYATGTNYGNFLTNVLNYINTNSISGGYPDIIVVQNEEGNVNYMPTVNNSNANKYIDELTAAVSICHAITTQTVQVTNGGFYCKNLVYLTYDYLLHNYGTSVANAFIAKCVPPHEISSGVTVPSEVSVWENIMSQYAATGIDYINMHWYEPQYAQGWNSTDIALHGLPNEDNLSGGMGAVISYLQSLMSATTPIMSNELGQWSPSGTLTNNFLSYLKMSPLDKMIWYDGDGPGHWSAIALHSTTSSTAYTVRNPEGTNFIYYMTH